MEKILGLDLGTNSIGWAIRDTVETENQIVDKGVLTFNAGVAYVEGKEQPKVKVRTESRGKRRNYQAEKYRKWELLKCLIDKKMCPLTIDELNEWRHYKKGVGRKYPISKEFHQWLQFDFNGDGKPDFEQFGFSKHENCYLFRYLAVSGKEEDKKLFADNPQLLGRVFYQMVQRRGFSGGDEGETKLIEEGRPKKDSTGKVIKGEVEVVGIKVIDALIKNKYKTLGAALYWGQKNNELETINNNRIRNRFTYRHYFEKEIDTIFQNLDFDKDPEFCKTVKKSIIWQRPLRSQKGLVGYCTLDAPLKSKTAVYYKPGKKRIPLSHPLYEEYRTWQFINNLKIEVPNEINKLIFLNEVVFPMFNRNTDFYFSDKKDKNGKITSKGLKSKIEEKGAKVLSNYDKDLGEDDEGTRYNANTFQNKLEKLFGENWRQTLRWDETLKGIEKTGNYLRAEDIWHLFYDALITKKQTENIGDTLIPILQKHFPDTTFDKKDFEKVSLDKGYASLSAASIRKILPYLKEGMIYSQAVFVSNLDKVFSRKLSQTELLNITTDFNSILKQHKADREVYKIVNDLISDRLYHRDRLSMGDNYVLDEYDNKDIEEKIKDTYKSKIWNKKMDEEKNKFIADVSTHYQSFFRLPIGTDKAKMFFKIYRIESKLHELLIEKYKADPNRVAKYLWHPSEQEKYPPSNIKKDKLGEIIKDENGKEIYFLGDPNPISRGFKNPMAMKTLQVLKKHLNYLLEVRKIDSNTKLVVEIARELNDANRRKAIEKFQRDNRTKRDGFKKKIEECFEENNISNRNITENLLNRYELWEEQSKRCLYCGQPIACVDVLNGTVQLEHTIPAKISNCSELFNLTIAHPECNATKAKRFPTQWTDNYENIKNNIKFIYAKYKSNEEIYKATFDSARQAQDKENKDRIIQKRHYHKMHMDYWRKKYETFTIEEVTNQFRRQQLTDTQIITKYALPYLRTVFNRVDVQKGIITDKFRKIFKIEPRVAKKDRSEHTHHAIDAAVLTLVPPASIRDNMMKEYNEAVDNNTLNTYEHPQPKNWDDFHQSYIISLKNEIIINHLSENRTLEQSFKYQRKRGEYVPVTKNGQPVFETDSNGNFIYHTDRKGNVIYKRNEKGEFILDENGEKIPVKKIKKKIQQGDTTRGKLHDESIFGMVKMPETEFREGKHRLKITDGKLTFKQNEKRKDELFVVKRVKITDIKSIDDFEKIVIDPNLGYYLKNEVKRRMKEQNIPFEKVIIQPIYAFGKEKDKNGDPLQPIRHLRCKVKTGADSYVQFPPEIKTIEKAFESKKEHKRSTYANNGEIPICAFYEWFIEGKRDRELIPYSILQQTKSYHLEKRVDIFPETVAETKGKGKNKIEYTKELVAVLRKKQHVIFYEKNIEELKELYNSDKTTFVKRVYKILKFEEGKIFFDYHLTSLTDKDILKEMESRELPKKGASKVDFGNPPLRLRLSQGALNMAIEGKHFQIKHDGTIYWL